MTEPALLVDTNVFSIFLRREAPTEYPRLVSWFADLLRAGKLAISAVSLYELRRGIKAELLQGRARRKAARLELVLRTVSVLGLDGAGFAAWNIAANIWAEGKGRVPAVVVADADLLIFATAQAHGRVLATTDARLVERLRDLGQSAGARLVELS